MRKDSHHSDNGPPESIRYGLEERTFASSFRKINGWREENNAWKQDLNIFLCFMSWRKEDLMKMLLWRDNSELIFMTNEFDGAFKWQIVRLWHYTFYSSIVLSIAWWVLFSVLLDFTLKFYPFNRERDIKLCVG